jgi:hypothetical protein
MRKTERVEIAIPKKEHAGRCTPQQSENYQQGIRNVHHREQQRCGRDGGFLAGQQPQ